MVTQIKQVIGKVSKTVLKNPHFDKDYLDDVVTKIIARTSRAQTSFRLEVAGFSHSAFTAKEMKIRVEKALDAFKIILRIQQIGLEEFWEVVLFTKGGTPKQRDAFCKEVRNSAALECSARNDAYSLSQKANEIVADRVSQETSHVPSIMRSTINPFVRRILMWS